MALYTSSTPKSFVTPRKQTKTPSAETDLLRNKFTTPKRPQKAPSTNTPECFNAVQLETPKATPKRNYNDESTYDELNNLTVAVRIRPMNARELSVKGSYNVVSVKDKELIVRSNPTSNSILTTKHIFQYDHIFWSCDESSPLHSNQEDVFMTMGKPLLNSAFRGYNACLFAYGQTGSGKSFSMMGKNDCEIVDIDSEEYSGITPRFCRDLFEKIDRLGVECTVDVCYFEIYNEKIHDLLALNQSNSHRPPLRVREHPEWGPYVVDLSIHPVKNYEELRTWLVMGNKNRVTAATTMNEKSSRSHSIFSIELGINENSGTTRRSKVSLVDLAGSERIGSCHSTEEKIRQGVSINKSLLTLGKVILALTEQKKNQFVPYRESVLTWLLKESLGGNSFTSMLATITPSSTNLDETIATLRYACQARTIVNRARVNESAHDRIIRELRSEVERLSALKLEYEKNSSLSSLSFNFSNNKEDMEDLKIKLQTAEEKLNNAEGIWKRRFMESEQNKLKELIESEKRREELESQFRILQTIDNAVNLSPYKTNFLEEVEAVLTEEEENKENNLEQNIINFCQSNGYLCTFSSGIFTVIDEERKRQTFLHSKDLNGSLINLNELLNKATWTGLDRKKLSKREIMENVKHIYEALGNLKPTVEENELNLIFAKVNKSMQAFETALLNNLKNDKQKSVTFDL